MEEVENQDQDPQEHSGPEVIRKDEPVKSEPEESQDSEEQSDTTEDVEKAKAAPYFIDHMGRELTEEQLKSEYTKSASYITKLEQQAKQERETAKKEVSSAMKENPLLDNVDPNVREAILQIVTPHAEKIVNSKLQELEQKSKQKADDKAFTARIEKLEEEYPGGNGLPKFDRNAVIKAMRESGEIFSPETMYQKMHFDKIIDKKVKDAMKGKSSSTKTEDTRSSPRKPHKKTPKSWEEASRRALSR